jgi:hypothetical protein
MDCRYKQWLFWCVIGAVWNHLVWKLSAFSCTLFRAAKQLRLSFVVLRMFSGFREIRFNLRPVLINTGGYVYIHIYIYMHVYPFWLICYPCILPSIDTPGVASLPISPGVIFNDPGPWQRQRMLELDQERKDPRTESERLSQRES